MNNLPILKPDSSEYPVWFAGEIEPIFYNDLIFGLSDSLEQSISILQSLHDEQLQFRYQPTKWTIKEIWQHIIDVERILAYRAVRYARNDKTILSGFDENRYAAESMANNREWDEMLIEYEAVRRSTIYLFKSFDGDMLLKKGTTGRSEMTVRAVGYLILGHDIHHLNTIKERYLNDKSNP